jgi:hypothetical protein
MTNDVEELLRDGIDRFTADATVPAGLAHRARQHHQHRRTAIRATAVAGTVVVVAAAVTAASGVFASSAQHPGGALQAQTTAYVTGRVAGALGAAAQRNSIQEIHTVGRNATFGLTTRNRAGVLGGEDVPRMEVWLHNGQLRQEGLTSGGKVVFDASSGEVMSAAGVRTITGDGVDYADRTWWHAVIREQIGASGPAPLSCSQVFLPPAVGSPVDWAAQIREARACGTYRVVGHQQVDGVNAIKLVSVMAESGPVPLSQTIWVDPTTYLPVRVATTSLTSPSYSVVGDFRWLQPTTVNLAELQVTVPAGFTKVAPNGLAGLPTPAYGAISGRPTATPRSGPGSSAP